MCTAVFKEPSSRPGGGGDIRVSLVEPDMCETEFSVVRFEGDSAKAVSLYEGMQPFTGKDVADIVYWAI